MTNVVLIVAPDIRELDMVAIDLVGAPLLSSADLVIALSSESSAHRVFKAREGADQVDVKVVLA